MDKKIGSTVKGQIEDLFKELDYFAEGPEQFDDVTMLGMKIRKEG